jgi:hypothetical protein
MKRILCSAYHAENIIGVYARALSQAHRTIPFHPSPLSNTPNRAKKQWTVAGISPTIKIKVK